MNIASLYMLDKFYFMVSIMNKIKEELLQYELTIYIVMTIFFEKELTTVIISD